VSAQTATPRGTETSPTSTGRPRDDSRLLPSLLRHDDATTVLARASITRQMLGVQALRGNRFVQSLVKSSVQRQAAAPSSTVPGLSAEVVGDIESKLEDDRDAALAAIVQALSSGGKIDLSYLQDRTMTAVSDTSRMRPGHSGLTSLSPGSGRPRPCRVEIGPDAFRSVSALYTTVMHEWQHVLQFRRPEPSGEASDELEARLWEIENLEDTGLWRDATYMGRIRGQLDHWWNEMTTEQQTPYKLRYDKALETITQMQRRLQDEQFRQQQGGG
jgi:hypothetical protein